MRTALLKSSLALEKASELMLKVAKPICFMLLSAIVVVILFEIIFRRIPILDVTWTEELAKMLSVILTCIAASAAFKMGFHIGITYLLTKIQKSRYLFWLEIIAQLFIAAFTLLVIIYGFIYAGRVFDQTAPSVRISMFWPHLFVPIGFLMILIHSFYFLLKSLNSLFAPGNSK